MVILKCVCESKWLRQLDKEEQERKASPTGHQDSLESYSYRRLGGSVGWTSDFGSGHDLTVREFETRIGLCAHGSEPGACFGFCLPLSAPPCSHSVSLPPSLPLSLSKSK